MENTTQVEEIKNTRQLYAIYSCETQYGGMHGYEYYSVEYCTSDEEAKSIGIENAKNEVILSFGLDDNYREDANEQGLETEEEIEAYVEEQMCENAECQVWVVDEEKVAMADECVGSVQELFYNDKDSFIEKYCSREVE